MGGGYKGVRRKHIQYCEWRMRKGSQTYCLRPPGTLYIAALLAIKKKVLLTKSGVWPPPYPEAHPPCRQWFSFYCCDPERRRRITNYRRYCSFSNGNHPYGPHSMF
ncbi:unnamed protein product [Macrosiphum euphorbiae]|uniref:Uncharacterized protein n=1 Tax=Macrosiphum euphorbiae TaxID=13131 RepID=A0AAV0Y496_9HEMI|nr:unnamed protein product [Macrosiphum euphorbiae]